VQEAQDLKRHIIQNVGDNMEFRDLLKRDIPKNQIGVGTKVGDLLTINIDENPSIIITGETGTGKSVMLDEILLQLMNKHTSEELRLILIDTTGVELNYYKNTTYSLLTAINDMDKAQEVLMKVLEEIERRKGILSDNDVSSIKEFNELFDHKIPKLVVAIDDNKSLLSKPDVDKMVRNIISDLDNLDILFILSTNDVHNKFFENDNNLLSKVLISFDNPNQEESQKVNLPFTSDLLTGKFIVYRNNNYEEYQNLEFDEKIIKEIID
jgi:Cdc6-like AAA superfamily ATPase